MFTIRDRSKKIAGTLIFRRVAIYDLNQYVGYPTNRFRSYIGLCLNRCVGPSILYRCVGVPMCGVYRDEGPFTVAYILSKQKFFFKEFWSTRNFEKKKWKKVVQKFRRPSGLKPLNLALIQAISSGAKYKQNQLKFSMAFHYIHALLI